MVVRYAAGDLTEEERQAIQCWLDGRTLQESESICGVKRSNVWLRQQRALAKMRERMAELGLRSSADLL